MTKYKLLVFIPVINELDNLKLLLLDLQKNRRITEILIIDDASSDGTDDYFSSLPDSENVPINYWHRSRRLGIGKAHMDALEYAHFVDFDYAVSMDGDLTHSTKDVERLIEEISNNDSDLIIGSRFLKNSRIVGWSNNRILLTRAAHFLTGMLLGMEEDLSSGLRGYKVSTIPIQALKSETMKGYDFFFKSAVTFQRESRIINQVPVYLYARNSGKSKMKLKNAISGLSNLIIFRMKQSIKPRQLS